MPDKQANNKEMSDEKLSALISIWAAVSILMAGFFQWWDITYDGAMITKSWVKILFLIDIILLGYAANLLRHK